MLSSFTAQACLDPRPHSTLETNINAINSAAIMSTNVEQPTTNAAATVDDAPYTSSLLRYDTQLKQISTLLSTMRDVLPYVTAHQRFQLKALIQATESFHATASKELEDLLKRAKLLIQYKHDKPARVFKNNVTRDDVEESLVALGRLINKLALKGDELEAFRMRLLRRWDMGVSV